MPVAEELTALYVRVPVSVATQLDERTKSLGRSKQSVVTDILSTEFGRPAKIDDSILDLDEVAELLRVSPADILERITNSKFPGRRFGNEWRFSRTAVLDWMSGTDLLHDHPTGF